MRTASKKFFEGPKLAYSPTKPNNIKVAKSHPKSDEDIECSVDWFRDK